jgi:predicted Zn-dependent protease with MMP-like domain
MPRKTKGPPGFSRGRQFFEELVREAFDTLPEDLKDHLENVVILVEEDSGEDFFGAIGEEQDLLGLYHGVPQKDRGFWYGNVLPDRIIIYQKPLERISRNLEELRENIRQTVIHEVGHYFGFDEEELAELEGRISSQHSQR